MERHDQEGSLALQQARRPHSREALEIRELLRKGQTRRT